MAEIIPFRRCEPVEPAEPTAEGRARCLDCGKIWHAVAPAGVVQLECPDCHTIRGVWMGLHLPPDEAPIWRCNCDSIVFALLPAGAPICTRCGLRATGWVEA